MLPDQPLDSAQLGGSKAQIAVERHGRNQNFADRSSRSTCTCGGSFGSWLWKWTRSPRAGSPALSSQSLTLDWSSQHSVHPRAAPATSSNAGC